MAEPIDAVLARAALLTADGRPLAAIELLAPVLREHPEHSGAWCRLSAAYLDAGKVDQSLDAAKRAMSLGERSWAHRLASLALVELGRYAEAVASAREAVRRDPVDWRCQVALADALAPTSPDEALDAAREAVRLGPRESRPHEVLGDAAARVRDVRLARRAYQDALRLDPGNEHIAASLRRLDTGDRPPPARRPDPPTVRRARFGRAQRTAMWLLVRRVSAWLGIGASVLLIAGLPRPSPLLVWFGFGLAVFVVGLAGRGWFGLPPGAHVGIRQLRRTEPLVVVAAGLLCVSVLSLLVWTVALSIGWRGTHLLGVVVGCSSACAGLGWLGLWRLRVRAR